MGIDVLSLLIFGFCIILFVSDKLPMATTAILGCALMVIFRVCDFKTAFSQFSSSTVVLTIGVMIIGAAISECGLAEETGAWIVRISEGSEGKLMAGTYLVSAAMSAFLTNSAVLAIFIPIIMGLSLAHEKLESKNLIMPIAMGCVLGGTSTLVGSTQQLTAQGLLEEAGERMFRTFDFTPVGGLIVLVGLVYCLTIGRRLGEKIWGGRPDEEYELKPDAMNYSKSKMIIMAVIFVMTVVLYITEWIPLAITSTSGALLCIIFRCITQKKAILSVNWNIVGRLGGCLGLAKALESAGGTKLIADAFAHLMGSRTSPFVLFAVLCLLVLVTSEFMSNSTAILIILPILIALAPELHLNVYSYALGITIASGVPMSCPLASSTLGMSMTAGYRFNDYFKYGFLMDVISYTLIITLIPMFYGLTV